MAANLLQFICPACDHVLRVPAQYLGMKGTCNACGARIALIGRADAKAPQTASRVTDTVHDPSPQPPTEKQLALLRDLGVGEAALRGLTRDRASAMIDAVRTRRQEAEPATDKQRDYLKRLGATPGQIAAAVTKARASALIEDLHVHPTRAQVDELQQLGATGAQIAGLKSKGHAAALIEALRGGA